MLSQFSIGIGDRTGGWSRSGQCWDGGCDVMCHTLPRPMLLSQISAQSTESEDLYTHWVTLSALGLYCWHTNTVNIEHLQTPPTLQLELVWSSFVKSKSWIIKFVDVVKKSIHKVNITTIAMQCNVYNIFILIHGSDQNDIKKMHP